MADPRFVRVRCVVEEHGERCKNGADLFFKVPVAEPEAQVGGFICPQHDEIYAWGSQVLGGDATAGVTGPMLINQRSMARNLALDKAVAGRVNPLEGWKEVKKFGPPINDTLLIRVGETRDPASEDPTRKAIKKYFPTPERKED